MLFPIISAQSRASAQTRDGLLLQVMEEARIPGLSVAVLEGGKISFLGAYGVRSMATDPPVDTLSVFEAAALTKPVVALAALQMVDEGLLNLDRPLSEYFEYPDLAHSGRATGITARMVLSHTSGLPNWRPSGGQLNVVNAPGKTFAYSGEGFIYLQRVLESIARRPLHAIVEDRVLTPVGMPNSSLVWKPEFGPVVAVGHSDIGTPFDKFTPSEANAAYSLHTTAADYARFLAFSLAGGGLSAETRAELTETQADAGDGLAWGLGWGLESTPLGRAVWHWGDNRGFKAFVAGYPADGRGFVFFSNSDNGMLALHRLVEILDGVPHPAVDWLAYERFDDLSFQVGRELRLAVADSTAPPLREIYQDLKSRFDRDAFTEDTLNDLGYRLLRNGEVSAAIAVLELNVSEYPNVANSYDSLGEAYMVDQQMERALLNYRVSSEMDPSNDTARAMIARLEAALRAGGR
ncbi:MAG: CubicO group peptidase (beta-lactamase class C family) [Rhodothermales bacterium]|jgi:CubicO group peptidase (beta-lactamase class C family)